MLTPENTDLIKQSIVTLIFTLKNIEVCTFCHFCSDVLLKLNKRLTEYLLCFFLAIRASVQTYLVLPVMRRQGETSSF
jgi:hypothetical protein